MMNDVVIMEVGNCREGSVDEVGSVGFIVGVFMVDMVEKFIVKGEIGDEVEVVYSFEVINESEDVLVVYGNFFEDCDFILDLIWYVSLCF